MSLPYRSHPRKANPRRRLRRRSPLVLFLLLLLWSIILGLGMAGATNAPSIGTVDPVPANYQLGQSLYLENCSSCHIAVPPAVLPTETWRQLLQDRQHYGQQLQPLVDPTRLLVWNYLRDFSRPLLPDEQTPFRINNSRYFQALHPRVELPQPTRLGSCISCHSGASRYDFRSLTPEWEDAP